tara:strand:+ start:630 stop:1736 length:1107 start_codon:yes stop_codon:yes gene_type:complete
VKLLNFKFVNFDLFLFLPVFLLICLSLATIYTISPSFFQRQAVFSIPGFAIIIFFIFLNYQALKNYSFFVYLVCFALLIGVLFLGQKIRGSSSWFAFYGFTFQPVEMVKVFFIVILAKYFARYYSSRHQIRHVLISGAYTLILVGLVLIQPDLGSAFIIAFIWFFMVVFIGTRKRYLISLFLIFILLMGLSWQFALKDYQKDRILVFLNPGTDPLGAGYNVIQSMIAIGSGGFSGRGLGFGSQSQMNFLPEQHTDFIFAVISEELGFVGVVLVLGLFALFFWRLIIIAQNADDNFAKFLIIGIIIFFLGHIFVNIGMNLGIMPVVGIPLPFLSYGGSSLLACFTAIGLAQSINARSLKDKSRTGIDVA